MICRYCKTRFEVTTRGYCTHDHQLVNATADGKCPNCNGELMDIRVESKLAGEPMPISASVPASILHVPGYRPAVISAGVPSVNRAPTSFWQLYFSPKGRIGRIIFFLIGILPVLDIIKSLIGCG
jgi:hypothetical protein